MRQSFSVGPPAANQPPQPQKNQEQASRWRVVLQRFRAGGAMTFIGAGALGALLALVLGLAFTSISRAIRPPPRQLTHADIQEAVQKALDQKASEPAVAARAYEVIRPSLVMVEAALSGPGGEPGCSRGTATASGPFCMTALRCT